jgi:hypothetical protein
MRSKQMQRWFLGALAVALLATAGCGERTLPQKQPQPIQGKLLHNGQPMQYVLVTLEPVNHAEGVEARGVTDADGTFTLRTYSNSEQDGVVPGEYKVVLEQHNLVEGGPLPQGAKPTPVTPDMGKDVTVVIAAGETEVTIAIP